ncbi:Fatty-acid amide hydrolase 1 [Sphaceloma murrayae]|uniref:Fatty-acid amide hydrolase 1 n=1 Tax=Sphaceloma murrayae TaxID=2082308 RepID=A0A2K1QX28_9PEZI|nr:Fatty-acid amide hydrolase 1 [Sphaceloma murrayae]
MAKPAFDHHAVDIVRRQDPSPALPVMAAAVTTPLAPLVYTYVTPSPGATPVPVTRIGQEVTSYIPQYTICALPPVAAIPQPTPTPWPSNKPYNNYTASYETGPGRCATIYSETLTSVCATTLTGLIDRYTVTSCAQNVTFSTQYGYLLVTATPETTNYAPATITPSPSPSVSVRTLTTYFLASWQALTTAGPPTDVDLRICSYQTNGTYLCMLEYQIWRPATVTYISTTTTSINLTTTMAGPSQLIFETITANISARLTTVSLIETAELTYSLESESTSVAERTATLTQTRPGLTETWTLSQARARSTRTTTAVRTSTVYGGTTTLRLSEVTPAPGEEGGDREEDREEKGEGDEDE